MSTHGHHFVSDPMYASVRHRSAVPVLPVRGTPRERRARPRA
ncbi:MAG TPA: hypothetical protein VFE05_20020 [Longimicrobiaceae bacterium]|jgi:hypothetical protein|nr:hypothetical protein [Longimicrobiaceae bacterium]